MIPCRDCPQRYIGQTSKQIQTRITEHKNATKRYNLRSLPAAHTYDNCHTFNWTETQLLGRAQMKHAHEFKEAWYSTDGNTINRHIDIPTIYYIYIYIRRLLWQRKTRLPSQEQLSSYAARPIRVGVCDGRP